MFSIHIDAWIFDTMLLHQMRQISTAVDQNIVGNVLVSVVSDVISVSRNMNIYICILHARTHNDWGGALKQVLS
jgi:hypothetical protein